MTKEHIQKEIKEMDAYIPVYKIEQNLKMPPTTLQKVLKGERELPKKWYKVLEAYFIKKAALGKSENKKEDQDNKSEIEHQIAALRKEVVPKERDTPIGRKIWANDQERKINELRRQLT